MSELIKVEVEVITAGGVIKKEGWRLENYEGVAAVSAYSPSLYTYDVVHLVTGRTILADISQLIDALRAMRALTHLRVDWTKTKPNPDKNTLRSIARIHKKFCSLEADPGE